MSIIGNALTATVGGGGLKIKSIQRGVSAVTNASSGQTRSINALISEVDTTKTVCNLLGFATSTKIPMNDSSIGLPCAYVMLKDSTHITVTTMNYSTTTSHSTSVSWEVIEFE